MIKTQFELRGNDFSSVTGTFAAVGLPITKEAVSILINIQVDNPISLSFDGVNSFITTTTTDVVIPLKEINQGISNGTILYVKHEGVAPTSGGFGVTFVQEG